MYMTEQKDTEGFLTAIRSLIFDYGSNAGIDIAEVALDCFLDEGIIKDIPCLGTLYKTGKLFSNIHDLFVTKHILVFSQQLKHGKLSDEDKKKHAEELENNPKKKVQELETILHNASQHTRYIQDKILANFYALYCDPTIDFNWDDFALMAQITKDLYPGDLVALKQIYEKQIYEKQDFDRYAIGRLARLGIVDYFNGMSVSRERDAGAKYFYAKINNLGKDFWEHGMKEIEIFRDVDGENRIL